MAKKFLDYTGLQTYDTHLKTFIQTYYVKRRETILEDAIDLNSIVSTGFYMLSATYKHGPDSSGDTANSGIASYAQLLVGQSGNDTLFQMLFRYNISEVYIRTGYNIGVSGYTPVFMGWKRLANSDELNNYLPLSGGTLAGTVYSRSILPAVNGSYNLGSSEYKYNDIYGNYMYGTNLIVGDGYGAGNLYFRTEEQFRSSIYYSAPSSEALVFANKWPTTSWIFNSSLDSSGRPDWTTFTGAEGANPVPDVQIKNKKVAINKFIPGGSELAYNLDVNGSINGNMLHENGTALANKYLALNGGTMYSDATERPLYIKSDYSYALLGFKNSNDTLVGSIGVDTTNHKPVFQYGNTTEDVITQTILNKYVGYNSTNITDTTQLKISGVSDNLAIPEESQVEIVEAEGNTIAYNQLAREINSTNYRVFSGAASITTGKITISGMAVVEESTGKGFNFISGHKYLYAFKAVSDLVGDVEMIAYDGTNYTISISSGTKFYCELSTATATHYDTINFRTNSYTSGNTEITNFIVFDLTQAFGSGNEPTSVDDAKITWLLKYASEHPEYNAGQLISSFGKLININRNIWDEKVTNDDGRLVTTNYQRCTPDTKYHLTEIQAEDVYIDFTFYDSNKNEIVTISNTYHNGSEIITPSNATYFKFKIASVYGTTYNYDICINVSDPSFNGTYVSHIEVKQQLPELNSAGSAHDSQVGNKITRRAGVIVDLGSLNWDGDGTANFYSDQILPNTGIAYQSICAKYSYSLGVYSKEGMPNKTIGFNYDGRLYLRDDDYTSGTDLKSSLSGVPLIHELPAPITEDATPLTPMATYYAGYEMQDAVVPYTLTRKYNLSIFDNVESLVDSDRIIIDIINTIKETYLPKSGGVIGYGGTSSSDSSTDSKLEIKGGLLKISNYGTYITIGARDSGFIRIMSSDSLYIDNEVFVNDNLYPYGDEIQSLGNSARYWLNGFIKNVYSSKTVYTNNNLYTTTVKPDSSTNSNIDITLPKESAGLLTNKKIATIEINDDRPAVSITLEQGETFSEGIYMLVSMDGSVSGFPVKCDYWQGNIAYVSNTGGKFVFKKSYSTGYAYVQFTYSGPSITIVDDDCAADYGIYYVYRVIKF